MDDRNQVDGRNQVDDRNQMDDRTTTVKELMELGNRFVAERGWKGYHNPKNLAMSVAIESAELMEIFQWKTPEEALHLPDDPELKEHLGEEMSDVLAYLLNLAQCLEIDLSRAFRDKMKKNALKYPLEEDHRF